MLSTGAASGVHKSTLSEDCISRNDWVCWKYVTSRSDDLIAAVREHVWITVVSLLLGLLIAFFLALVARQWRRSSGLVLGTSTVLYTIPSLAMFALMIPVMQAVGQPVLSSTTVIIGLALYSLVILTRGILTGLDGVSADVREAAVGMGYGPMQLLRKVEVPLALPTIFAALRVAMVSTVALTTIGVILNHGGLGNLIGHGYDTNFRAEVLTASVLTVVLAISGDLLLRGMERLTTPWRRGVA